jgi:hypothetical protein
VNNGLIPRTEPRGSNTRYTDLHRLWIVAIQKLRESGTRLHAASKIVREASSVDEVRVLAGEAPVVDVKVAEQAPIAAAPVSAPSAGHVYRPAVARAREHWEHILICPGVELRVRADADTEAQRVAREIEGAYAMRDVGTPR